VTEEPRAGVAVQELATAVVDAVEQAIIGKAVALLSGPGGLASFLRRPPPELKVLPLGEAQAA